MQTAPDTTDDQPHCTVCPDPASHLLDDGYGEVYCLYHAGLLVEEGYTVRSLEHVARNVK